MMAVERPTYIQIPATSQVNISTTKPTSVQIMDVYGRLLLNRDISDGQKQYKYFSTSKWNPYLCDRRPEI
ncbi:MAG: hypothetical protein IPN86_04940 [Saprospiraceae bacterium]|nr:hypothetical protein [Saprospiraceae bacterium]